MGIKSLSVLIIFTLLTLSFDLLAQSHRFCVESAKSKVVEHYPYLETILSDKSHPANYYIKLDCRESLKITDYDDPYSDSAGYLSHASNLASILRFGGIPNAMEIMTPYCRKNHEYFGTFCMAADTFSANEILEDPILFGRLVETIKVLARALGDSEKVDFVKETLKIFPNDKRRAVTMAGFLGLDDNGTQTMRLKASLLKLGAFERYAKLFPFLTDGLRVKDSDGNFTLTPISRIFYATRVGNATIPGVDPNISKSYKAYAGLYFGCKMSEDGFGLASTQREIALFGYTYEIIKVSGSLGKDADLKKEFSKYHKLGTETGSRMSKAAAYGYNLCR